MCISWSVQYVVRTCICNTYMDISVVCPAYILQIIAGPLRSMKRHSSYAEFSSGLLTLRFHLGNPFTYICLSILRMGNWGQYSTNIYRYVCRCIMESAEMDTTSGTLKTLLFLHNVYLLNSEITSVLNHNIITKH